MTQEILRLTSQDLFRMRHAAPVMFTWDAKTSIGITYYERLKALYAYVLTTVNELQKDRPADEAPWIVCGPEISGMFFTIPSDFDAGDASGEELVHFGTIYHEVGIFKSKESGVADLLIGCGDPARTQYRKIVVRNYPL